MREDVIIQSEPEKQDENQILENKFVKLSGFELKFSNAADFESKFPQRVRFWTKFFYNASDFELKFLQRVRFWIENFTTRQILNENIFLKSLILEKKSF